jgi:HAD superfamily hydrolase (TIGR01549 family)
MKYQAILFDFDFTLGDASASIYEGFCYAMEKMGYPRPTFEAVRLTIGAMLEDGFTQLTGEKDPEKRSEFRRWFQEKVEGRQAEKTVLFPGAEDLLRSLHQKGVKLGVVTNKRSTTLHEILDRFELTSLMSFTTGGEMVKAAKPDPEGLNKGIQALGVDRSAVLYCGDTVIDAATARNAGVDFCAVLNGTTPGEDFAAYPSVHIAPDLPELKTWLEG